VETRVSTILLPLHPLHHEHVGNGHGHLVGECIEYGQVALCERLLVMFVVGCDNADNLPAAEEGSYDKGRGIVLPGELIGQVLCVPDGVFHQERDPFPDDLARNALVNGLPDVGAGQWAA
jgi:hypothetical protein